MAKGRHFYFVDLFIINNFIRCSGNNQNNRHVRERTWPGYPLRLYVGNFGTAIGGLANNFLLLFKGKQEGPQLSRIEIVPGGGLTVRQGEPVNFTAIGYTADGIPVGGLKFDWTIEDTERNRTAHNLPNGTFPANRKGNFTVTAKAGGFQAQIGVTVEENLPLMTMKRIKDDESKGKLDVVNTLKQNNRYTSGKISSKKDYKDKLNSNETIPQNPPEPGAGALAKIHGPNANAEMESEKPSGNPRSRMLVRPADEDGWGNNNWWMIDDPGNQTGDAPGTSPDAGAGNGNFQLSAPVAALPGRGIDLGLSLNYNSRVWSKAGNVMSFDAEKGFPAPGWNLGFGKMMFLGTSGGCILIDADGTNRGYTGTISNYNYTNYSSTSFTGHTTDGSFIDYSCSVSTYNGVTSMSGSSSLPSGTKVDYYANSTNGKQAFPTRIADAQGNFISVAYRNNRGPEIQTVIDTMGRAVTFNYDSINRLISVDVPKMDNAGTRTAVRLHYKQITLNPGFAYPLTTDTNNSYPYVVDAIYYPGTGTGYWFNDTDSYSSYGMIAKVIEQRGMNWSGTAGDQGTVTAGTMSKQAIYNYTLSPNYTLTDAPTYSALAESWDGMDTAPAVTSYSINMNSSPRTITVTQPNGVKSKQYIYNAPGLWNDGLIYQDETLDTANTQLSKSVSTWAQGSYDSPRPNQTQITDEKGQVLTTTYTFGTNYNQLISQKEYGYDGTTLLKEARNTYENNAAYTGRHIFSLVKTAEIYDGSGNRVSKTDYEYDDNAVAGGTGNLKATPDVTMHYSSYDPYTTETQNGSCATWNYSSCTYEGESIYIDPPNPDLERYFASCNCQEYNIVSAYDPSTIFRGNLTKTTVYSDAATPSGAIAQTKQYDDTGNLVAESASCCELKTYDYTLATQYAYPTTQTRGSSDPNSPLRNTATAVYDFNTGLIKQTTDPNGRTAYTSYNPDTLRPTVSTSSTGAYSQTTYDESAMTITEEVKEANGTLAGKNISYLNGLGLVKRQDSIGPNNVVDIVETKYNNLAEVWKESRPYRTGDTVQWSEKFYDLQGRLFKIVGADGSETKAFYNETQRPDSASTQPGATIRVMDAWGRERWGRYDAQERLAEIIEPNPNGNGLVLATDSLVTNYTFDTLGRLVQTNQSGQLRNFKYDSLGRLTRQKLAEQTATLNDAGTFIGAGQTGANWGEAFWYDDRSNVTQRTDPRGVKTFFSYSLSGGAPDPLNRIQSRTYDTSGPLQPELPIENIWGITVSYEYMTTGDKGRIKKITTSNVLTEEYGYDSESRVNEYKQTVSGRESYPMTTSYLYDTLDRVKEVTYPAQYGLVGNPRKIFAQTFDTANRLTSLTYNGVQQVGGIVYNASDQTTSINIGTAGTNQVNEQYSFDPQTGLLTNQKTIRGANTLLDLSYEYNRNNSVGTINGKTGHLTKIIDNLNTNKNREYEFDALGRLTKAKGGQNGTLWNQTYSYDHYGNRTNVAKSGVAADGSPIPLDGIPNLSYDNTSNRIATAGFEYDVAGNQIRALAEDGVTWLKYEYDAASRLRVVKKDDTNQSLVQAFIYGSTNTRLIDYNGLTYQNTFFCSVRGTVLAEYVEYTSFVSTWTKSYTYLGGRLLSTITLGGTGSENTEFDHPDRLGTSVITNQSVGSSYEQSHLPFGRSLGAESTGFTSKRFTSYERSNATQLDYAVNRTYDSKQGRFTQVDPIGMQAANLATPQTLNLYSYCANDPINHIDPDGLFFGKLFKAIGNFLKKAWKWIVIAVVVAVVVFAVIASHGAATGFLVKLGGWIAKLGFAHLVESGGFVLGTSSKVLLATASLGAISDRFRQKEKRTVLSTGTPLQTFLRHAVASIRLASKFTDDADDAIDDALLVAECVGLIISYIGVWVAIAACGPTLGVGCVIALVSHTPVAIVTIAKCAQLIRRIQNGRKKT